MTRIDFELTDRARQVIEERKIHTDWVERVLRTPARLLSHATDPEFAARAGPYP